MDHFSKFVFITLTPPPAEYFDQHLGPAHSKCWLKLLGCGAPPHLIAFTFTINTSPFWATWLSSKNQGISRMARTLDEWIMALYQFLLKLLGLSSFRQKNIEKADFNQHLGAAHSKHLSKYSTPLPSKKLSKMSISCVADRIKNHEPYLQSKISKFLEFK